MRTLTAILFAMTAVLVHSKPSDVIISGPSGVVTDQGPVGGGGKWNDGGWGGNGGGWGGNGGGWGGNGGGRWKGEAARWDDGGWDDGDDGQWKGNDGRWGGNNGGGWKGEGARWDDNRWDGDDGSWGGHGHYSDVVQVKNAVLLGASEHVNGGNGHGIVVRGPPTAPVTIVGPAGKVVAKGLWGPTHKGVGHW